ncbi:hypothetical protein RJ641_004453 [Dillenia turbinata]|uniref:Uncharacterized protein n=1 Tax=Dillenia turbinata TaxID=194707 RepID=A0AAN8Z890_9MAGN
MVLLESFNVRASLLLSMFLILVAFLIYLHQMDVLVFVTAANLRSMFLILVAFLIYLHQMDVLVFVTAANLRFLGFGSVENFLCNFLCASEMDWLPEPSYL